VITRFAYHLQTAQTAQSSFSITAGEHIFNALTQLVGWATERPFKPQNKLLQQSEKEIWSELEWLQQSGLKNHQAILGLSVWQCTCISHA